MEEQTKPKRKIDRLLIIVLIVSVLVLIGLAMFGLSESGQCLKNPYVYGAKKQGNIECSCQQFNDAICPAKFFFNSSGMTTQKTICGSTTTNYNNFNTLNNSLILNK